MIGIKELADRLNISIGTISRALNNKPDVNPQTRAKVLEAAKKYGYVPNQSGRSLRQGATNTVGLMMTIHPATSGIHDNFFLGLTEGIQSVLFPHNLDLIVLPRQPSMKSADFLKRILARRFVDALIITATEVHDERLPLLTEANIPFVSLGRSAYEGKFVWADLDFEYVVKASVDRLVALGHRSIGVVMPETDENFGAIHFKASKEALASHGLSLNPDHVLRVDSSEAGGYRAAEIIFAKPDRPTAMLLVYEMMADGFYRRMFETGLTPGKEMSLVGVRDHPEHWNLVPRLTAFRVDVPQLGKAVGRQLLSQMPAFAREYEGQPEALLWPMELVPGNSDGPPHSTN